MFAVFTIQVYIHTYIHTYTDFLSHLWQSFGTTKYGYRLGPTANFDDWSNALATIVQIITGDEWYDIYWDCNTGPPACTVQFSSRYVYGWPGPELSFGDCGSSYARFYFVILKLVCENIMLNLFIGMILDNFSFITDDVAHVEDFRWSKGPSASQILTITDVFKQLDAGTGYMSISALHLFLCRLPRPFGFRNDMNELDFTDSDRVFELLIRAELNMVLNARRRKQEEDAKSPLLRRLFRLPKLPEKRVYTMDVSYIDLMMTILYWRKPSMVPRLVKIRRLHRVKECIIMAHMLVITDFFRGIVARRHHKRLSEKLVRRQNFLNWSNEDQHRMRRALHLAQARKREKEYAGKTGLQHWQVYVPPAFYAACRLSYVDSLPEHTVTQYAMIREQRVKIPKPFHGIDVLTQAALTLPVVLRFTDPTHAAMYPGYLIADMAQCMWGGWYMSNLAVDSIYEPANTLLSDGAVADGGLPVVKRATPLVPQNSDGSLTSMQGPLWTQIELQMRDDPTSNAYHTLGILRDVQSFVLWEGRRQTIPTNVVRLNVIAQTSTSAPGQRKRAKDKKSGGKKEEGVTNAKGHDAADRNRDAKGHDGAKREDAKGHDGAKREDAKGHDGAKKEEDKKQPKGADTVKKGDGSTVVKQGDGSTVVKKGDGSTVRENPQKEGEQRNASQVSASGVAAMYGGLRGVKSGSDVDRRRSRRSSKLVQSVMGAVKVGLCMYVCVYVYTILLQKSAGSNGHSCVNK
jgi:hypothetical protein